MYNSLWQRTQYLNIQRYFCPPKKFVKHVKQIPFYDYTQYLKILDTISNCQRPVFSLDVSQHMHKITNLWKFELDWLSKLRENNGRKNALVAQVVCFQMVDFETSKSNSEASKSSSNILVEKYFFLENGYTSEGAVSISTAFHCLLPSKFLC